MKRTTLVLIMGFSFWGLFGQTNKFKTVDVDDLKRSSRIHILEQLRESLPKGDMR